MKQSDARRLERLLKLATLHAAALRGGLAPQIQQDLQLEKDARALQSARYKARDAEFLDAKIAQAGDIYDIWCAEQLGATQIKRAALKAEIAPTEEALARAEARRIVIGKRVQEMRRNRSKK